MIVIQDALPKALADDARTAFWNAKYQPQTQHKPDYYPDRPGEAYRCSFKRAAEIDLHVMGRIGEVVMALLRQQGFADAKPVLFAYKMVSGDFFRLHDDQKNGIGFILYLSDRWEWDWGGLLMVKSGDGYVSYKPQFNQLVIVEPKGTPHFVTEIADHAHHPRYALVGFF